MCHFGVFFVAEWVTAVARRNITVLTMARSSQSAEDRPLL